MTLVTNAVRQSTTSDVNDVAKPNAAPIVPWSAHEEDRLNKWNASLMRTTFPSVDGDELIRLVAKISNMHHPSTLSFASQVTTSAIKLAGRQDKVLNDVQKFGLVYATLLVGLEITPDDAWGLLNESKLGARFSNSKQEEELHLCIASVMRGVQGLFDGSNNVVSDLAQASTMWHITQHRLAFTKWTKHKYLSSAYVSTEGFFQNELAWIENAALPLLARVGGDDVSARVHVNLDGWRREGQDLVEQWEQEKCTQVNANAKAA